MVLASNAVSKSRNSSSVERRFFFTSVLLDKWIQCLPAAHEPFVETFAGIDRVLVLDGDAALVTNLVQRGDELWPVDFAVPRNAEPVDRTVHPAAVTSLGKHLGVLGMDMIDAILVLLERADVVDALPVKMRRIELNPQRLRRHDLEPIVPRVG